MKSAILILTLAVSAGVHAQEWVSVGAARSAAPSAPSNLTDSSGRASFAAPAQKSSSSSNELVGELSMQVEALQQEVASLRGQLEEQNHQIQRMRDEQQQRYLDLDRRLSVLLTATPSTPASAAPAAVAISADAKAVPKDAGEAYQQAMSLVREKKYPEASAAFEHFVKAYPKDALVGNALYWSGEVWLVRGENEKALAQFQKIVAEHPGHDKAADATYKAGVTLHRLGKTAEAKVWLKKVIDTYTGKADSTVKLARAYLDKL